MDGIVLFSEKLDKVQKWLQEKHWDGWLLYDFRKTNDLTCRFLDIHAEKMLTRRFFYWIPSQGIPIKIVHQIEQDVLKHLPGNTQTYASWESLHSNLSLILQKKHLVAMEFSPLNAIPYISKVDAGTIDLVRSFGVEVVSSGDLLQHFTSIWTEEQLKTHKEAADTIERALAKAWKWIATCLQHNKNVSERDIQQLLLEEFDREGCLCEDPPICAVNSHSADPHFSVDTVHSALIKHGDFILIDLWCKKKLPHAVYADITRVGVAATKPSPQQQAIFDIVKKARDTAMDLIHSRLAARQVIQGCEVDQACRQVIQEAGYGQYFIHRTGHNIGEKDHGDGAHIDNFETQDFRQLLPGTCFSIEPGIYLPGQFGIRLEHDVYLEKKGGKIFTTPMQTSIECCS